MEPQKRPNNVSTNGHHEPEAKKAKVSHFNGISSKCPVCLWPLDSPNCYHNENSSRRLHWLHRLKTHSLYVFAKKMYLLYNIPKNIFSIFSYDSDSFTICSQSPGSKRDLGLCQLLECILSRSNPDILPVQEVSRRTCSLFHPLNPVHVSLALEQFAHARWSVIAEKWQSGNSWWLPDKQDNLTLGILLLRLPFKYCKWKTSSISFKLGWLISLMMSAAKSKSFKK